eukprot:TRINITY_DN1229_c0_g1_i1.p2 TRINITY_DN1229_c0_g1~~TRINITY_DN1229_c0_g1_i1.p2  ORF type:complete len:526 (-),score=187.72 TRINITY_DN1229_c0_g1_i1:2814-4391(-)
MDAPRLFVCCCAALLTCASASKLLYLPLDERFTTRNAFLNLGKLVPYEILTPPTSLLPNLKVPPPLDELHAWVDENMAQADAAIISSEMYIYGGLIQSRVSNDTMDEVQARMEKLLAYKTQYPKLQMLFSAVVMRIPAYNGDFEEPWYWEYYGYDLYEFSFYSDKYYHTHDPADEQAAIAAAKQVPPAIIKEFLWRRSRNFNITRDVVNAEAATNPLEFLYITQDDNAQYGFNIEEADALRRLVASNNIGDHAFVYPGADEVGLTMLSMLSVSSTGKSPKIQLVYRDPSTVYNIPNYEGQPMVTTLQQQTIAAGGTFTNDTQAADVFMLVNNFSEDHQLEAPNQLMNGRSTADYNMFTPYLQKLGSGQAKTAGFADNRFSNGGDLMLLQYILEEAADPAVKLDMHHFCYAGWNTDGNTLGTVISNAIILALFNDGDSNTFFNVLRLIEDEYYQASYRTYLENYVSLVNDATVSDLSSDLPFYGDFSNKTLGSRVQDLDTTFGLQWVLDSCYYPWNRTFEIGFVAH